MGRFLEAAKNNFQIEFSPTGKTSLWMESTMLGNESVVYNVVQHSGPCCPVAQRSRMALPFSQQWTTCLGTSCVSG